MANDSTGFEQMLNIWQQGQETFLKAQKEAFDGFGKALSGSMPASPTDVGADAMEAWQGFIKSWAPAWDPSSMMTSMPGADMFTRGNDAMFGMIDPSNWMQHAPEELRKILQTVSQGPRFADLATPQMDAAEAWRETLDYQQAAMDFSKVLQNAWAKAYERFNEKYSLEDLQSGEVNEALDAWLNAANAALLETQHTQEFMDAQKRLLRASVEIKARQRELAETWSEAYQMPTRTEVDDLSKIVHELRREVRILKRELASVKASKSS